jgi:hypothetical protein
VRQLSRAASSLLLDASSAHANEDVSKEVVFLPGEIWCGAQLLLRAEGAALRDVQRIVDDARCR